MSDRVNRVLIMTIGTGDQTQLEKSLFVPLQKSIAIDDWTQLVLLPSTVTETFAKTVRMGIQGIEVSVRPLPEGEENNADRAYAHFDSILAEVLQETPAEDISVDFTRGTKAMSAALVLAAARHEIPNLRYVTGQRDERGMVLPGSEKVQKIRTTVGAGHRRLDLARNLMRRGSFIAAGTVLHDMMYSTSLLYPDDLTEIATTVQTAVQFYAAWDRLDYAAASKVNVGEAPDGWKELWPTSTTQEWVVSLADGKEKRRLIVDLLANGKRRLKMGQHEDALVRAYRVLEMIGQVRLLDHGLDSGNLDPDHAAVRAVQVKIVKKKQAPLWSDHNSRLQAGRFQVSQILKECGDPLAGRLLNFENKVLLKPSRRNRSVLIHGFVVAAPGDPGELHGLFDELEKLARDDGCVIIFDDWLAIAQIPAFAAI